MRVLCIWRKKLFFLTQKHNSPLFIGVCVGIAFSLIITPFLQKNCHGISTHLLGGMRLSNIRDLRSNNIDDTEDFEPYINLNGNVEVNKKGDEDSHSGKLIRPRYYSTELGMKDKLLVAVISSKETIRSFGVTLNKTLNHYVDKLIFFLDGTGSKKLGLNIPIVGFKDFKPHIKIFRILSYISEIYSEDYSYFLFVSDHTYVNGRRLMSLLEHLSVSQNVHMGIPQAQDDAIYCDLDSGIILSQSILQLVAKELLWCIKHSYSDIDSDNFGRCVLHASNVPCKSTYQDQIYKSYSLQANDWEVSSFPEKAALINSALEEAVTVQNVKKTIDMSRLHIYFLQDMIIQTKKDIADLRVSVKNTMKTSPLEISYPWPLGSPVSHTPPTRHDLIYWDTFNASHLFMPNEHSNIELLTGVDLADIKYVIKSSASHIENKLSNTVKFEKLSYGHRRYDPVRGMDYLLSLSFRDKETNELIDKRVEAYRGLTQPEFLQMPYVTEIGRVNMVLFIDMSEIQTALDFMKRLQTKVKIEQIIVTFCLLYNEGDAFLGKDDPYRGLKDILKEFTQKYYDSESRATFVHLTVPNGKPSSFALIDLALKNFPVDSLILVVEASSSFDTNFVNKVRMNTIRGWQAFSPIPFILYHPKLVKDDRSYKKMDVKSSTGHFDDYYFSCISFYVEDYFQARKLIAKKIPLFRSEKNLQKDRKFYDISVYGMFLEVTDLHVLRGVEPSLIIPYSQINCPANDIQGSIENRYCKTRQSLSLGERSVLSKLVYEYNEIPKKV